MSSTAYAPIAVFAYARPDHLTQTLAALRRNEGAAESDLFVFSDGAKTAAKAPEVAKVRNIIEGIEGFKSVTAVKRETNQGLAASIIQGVTQVLADYDRVIVLEDDMVTSPYFLEYINGGLEKYQSAENVASIHGYTYPVAGALPETFFLRGADCWGWGTWKQKWKVFRPDGSALLKELQDRNLVKEFDFGGAYPYSRMLKHQIQGKNDSWAIRWHASAFLANCLTLYPGQSLVTNIGLDGSGEHCSTTDQYGSAASGSRIQLHDIDMAPSAAAYDQFAQYFRSVRGPSLRRYLHVLRNIKPLLLSRLR